jgi:hypothetical protein
MKNFRENKTIEKQIERKIQEVPIENKVTNKFESNSEVQEKLIINGEIILQLLKKYLNMNTNGI